jgi:hypothetical protein
VGSPGTELEFAL